MRRQTAITLIVLFLILTVVAIVQATQDAPEEPFRGPTSGTPLPPELTAVPST